MEIEMSIKGFRVFDTDGWYESDSIYTHRDLQPWNLPNVFVRFHTGTFDRNNNPIYEGDMLRSMTCEIPFKVENIVDFLMMCGEYRAKNGVEIFPSLEIVND